MLCTNKYMQHYSRHDFQGNSDKQRGGCSCHTTASTATAVCRQSPPTHTDPPLLRWASSRMQAGCSPTLWTQHNTTQHLVHTKGNPMLQSDVLRRPSAQCSPVQPVPTENMHGRSRGRPTLPAPSHQAPPQRVWAQASNSPRSDNHAVTLVLVTAYRLNGEVMISTKQQPLSACLDCHERCGSNTPARRPHNHRCAAGHHRQEALQGMPALLGPGEGHKGPGLGTYTIHNHMQAASVRGHCAQHTTLQ